MENASQPAPSTPKQTPPQSPALTTPVTASVANEAMPKKRGQISVDKAFIIIYASVLLAIFAGPILFTGDDSALTPFALFILYGVPLIILLMILHIFLHWREKKRKS